MSPQLQPEEVSALHEIAETGRTKSSKQTISYLMSLDYVVFGGRFHAEQEEKTLCITGHGFAKLTSITDRPVIPQYLCTRERAIRNMPHGMPYTARMHGNTGIEKRLNDNDK